jgi:NADP-dependent 3-hydroxy acid dehydrogenase YdfG
MEITKMSDKQTMLITGATGNIGGGAAVALAKRVEKPDKAMNDEVLGRRLWDELVQLTALMAE